MSKIIGRFYFKIDINNNLVGVFSNNLHTINYSEFAQRLLGSGFTGEFNSTWTDDLGTFHAKLKINLKPHSLDIYTLQWSNGLIQFFGEGIIIDNILIGDYRNFNSI